MSTQIRHSKKDAKKQKTYKKQEGSFYTKKVCIYQTQQVEQELKNLQDEKSQFQYQDPTVKRAMKWWQRIDQKYYQSFTLDDIQRKRRTCTSNQLMSIGEMESSQMPNYRQHLIYGRMHSLSQKNKLRVFYKSGNPPQSAVATFSLQSAIANYNSEAKENNLDQSGIRVTNKNRKFRMENDDDNDGYKLLGFNEIKSMRLDLQQYQIDEQFCNKILKVQEVEDNVLYLHEIDKELALWEHQLKIANQKNNLNWDLLIDKLKNNSSSLIARQFHQFDQKIMKYRDKLYWATVLRSFQHGFKDKTKKMLQIYMENQKINNRPAKGLKGQNSKKFFETDCKICFCSDNTDSNQVLYCDSCNTSFHLACYGLTSVPQQQKYFCERCSYIKKQQQRFDIKIKKPCCQICLKNSFPMKKVDEHLYHVTCLVLFNFVEFRQNKMVLKGSLTHENIMKMVIENQLEHEQCNYCRKLGGGAQLGMQIKCSYEGCQNYSHPICAYLHGCKFQLKISKYKVLDVKMLCNDHLGSRIEQIYLRRYMCNLYETSQKSYSDFLKQYQKDQQNLNSSRETIIRNKKKYPNRILMMTKQIKNIFQSKIKKQAEQIETETQAILNKLKKKNN